MLLVAFGATASAQGSRAPKPTQAESTSEQRAPKGMCRIWLKGVAAAQQPAPTDCATAIKNCPPNGRVIFGDTDPSKRKQTSDTATAAEPKSPLVKSLTGSKKTPPIIPRKPPT